MKKIFLPIGVLAILSLAACENKNNETDTTGAVPAKVVNTLNETEIIVSEDSNSSALQNAGENLNQAGENIKEAAKEGKEAVAEKTSDIKDKVSEKAKDVEEKAKSELKSGAKAVEEKAKEIKDNL